MPIKYTAMIVDDESNSIAVIDDYIMAYSDIDIIGRYTKSRQSIAKIIEHKPSLLFLDIQMPVMNGFDLLQAIQHDHNPYIIFTTAYEQYAIQAFEVNAIAYLLKPFSKEKFNRAVEKFLQVNSSSSSINYSRLLELLKPVHSINQYLDKIMIKDNKRIFYISVDDVLYFEASGDYVQVFTSTGKYLIHDSITSLESKLSPNQFIRIHRSHIIHTSRVKEFIPYFNGEYQVVMINKDILKLSRTYKEKASSVFKGL